MEIKYVFDRKDIPELGSKLTHDINFILEDSEIDTVIELLGGVEPAFGYAEKALTCGKNLVTANKMMMASHYGSLSSLAREKDAMLCYTAAVGGAILWIVNLDRASRVSQINEISGIINGTTNYILTAMHSRKLSFRYALAEAQKLGYAEADPSSDIDGIDICNKCVLSANIAFGIDIPQEEVQVFGIGSVNESDIKNAEAMGYRIKMFADAIRNGEGLNIWVEPVFVPHDSMEASIHDNFNLVSFVSELTGKESFYGQGAGRYPTASNVVQDCVDIIYGRKLLYNEVMIKAKIANNIKYRYYVRCDFDEFIMQIEEQRGDGYIITKPVCVHEIHEWAKRNKDDQKLFFASIRKED
jgi:homoserine dehydrogenase